MTEAPLLRPGDAEFHRLEEVFLNSMTPPEQLLYDGWLIRFALHDAKRARSVNVMAPGLLPLDDKLDYCEMLFRERQMTTLYRILLRRTALDDGWRQGLPALR
jgi:hypothetical protein